MVRLEATKPRDASVETWNPEEGMRRCEKSRTANFLYKMLSGQAMYTHQNSPGSS